MKTKYVIEIMFFSILFCVRLVASPNKEEELLIKYKNEINQAADAFNISPRIIASIIYSEHKLNVKLGESVLDFVFAKSGYNSSLGIAQVKINTASWIEKQVHNPGSQFYMGKNIEFLIPISKNSNDLINRLNDPKKNILYAACYIAMIEKIWEPVFSSSSLKNIKCGIIATIYSLGIQNSEGEIRQPHADAKMNHFGETAQDFFDFFVLRDAF